MAPFLIKSAVALTLFLCVYYLLLQRESMHRFNRFYLLATLVFSMALPCISIPVYVEAETMPQTVTIAPSIQTAIIAPAENINYWPYVLWGFYGLVTLLLSVRFVLNIRRFYSVKKQNNTLPYKGATVVLLDEPVPPHTFFSNIFVSREDYENRHAEPELFTHELAHVNQHHTLDILFVEALKTLMWFNPLLYLYKRAIQLNHEFLADAATLSQHHNVTNYQSLLLGKSQPKLQFALASSINFSITKKRFIMMTKTTSKGKATLLKLASLPVLAGLVIALSTETIAQNNYTHYNIQGKANDTLTDRDQYYSGVRFIINDHTTGLSIDKVYEQLTEEEKDLYVPNPQARLQKRQPTVKEYEKYKDNKTYAVWIDSQHIDNSTLAKYKPQDFAFNSASFVHQNARSEKFPQPYQVHLYTHDFFDKNMTTYHFRGESFTITISGKNEVKPTAQATESQTVAPPPVAAVNEKRQNTAKDTNMYNYVELENKPEYPGGMVAFYSFVNKNVVIPEGVEGNIKTTISFIIEADGSVSDMQVLRTNSEVMAAEVLKVLEKMEKWKPATIDGKAVRTSYILPVVTVIHK